MSETEKLINQAVVHKSLGKGVIRNADGKYLEVYFPEKGRNSRFSYPSCFDGFMVLENSELQSDVIAAVEIWRVESGAASKEKIRQKTDGTPPAKYRLSLIFIRCGDKIRLLTGFISAAIQEFFCGKYRT